MTITVNVTPEVEAALARQAAHGRAVEIHIASLLEEAAQLPTTPPPQDQTAQPKTQRPPGKKTLTNAFELEVRKAGYATVREFQRSCGVPEIYEYSKS
jgi:hypothetical protein